MEPFQRYFGDMWIRDVVDILLVALLNYRLLKLIRGTRAWRIVFGVIAFVMVWTLAEFFHLSTLAWLMKQAVPMAPILIALLLLPELRAMLEGFGKIGMFPHRLVRADHPSQDRTLNAIVTASTELSSKHVGALIVIERGPSLPEVVASGVPLGAEVTAQLLGSIFYGANPLHDGATLIRGDVVVAAACRLPLSENPRIDQRMHLRHRAGIGVTEVMDCVAIIVSEERGTITVAANGDYRRAANADELRALLIEHLRGKDEEGGRVRRRRNGARNRQEPNDTDENGDTEAAEEAKVGS